MMQKPIFVATHPRACSTAFERVFMTRRDTLQCIHEPFGDAFYFGPERLSERYEHEEGVRCQSGFSQSTYKTILDRIERERAEACFVLGFVLRASCGAKSAFPILTETRLEASRLTRFQGKRLFIKDIIHYLVPPQGKPASIAPSLSFKKKGVGTPSHPCGEAAHESVEVKSSGPPYPYDTQTEPGNPTVVPTDILNKFHFTFLIRHPSKSIPSYWRCTVPPMDKVTGFHSFMPSEAGYNEVRRVFEYLKSVGQVGPAVSGQADDADGGDNAKIEDKIDICVVDADDLLDFPAQMIEKYCRSVGIEYNPEMLKWDDEASHRQARDAFEKWRGFHDDAINSSELRARKNVSLDVNFFPKFNVHTMQKHQIKSLEEEMAEWSSKYGPDAAKVIRQTVEANLEDYNYMKQFAIKVD